MWESHWVDADASQGSDEILAFSECPFKVVE